MVWLRVYFKVTKFDVLMLPKATAHCHIYVYIYICTKQSEVPIPGTKHSESCLCQNLLQSHVPGKHQTQWHNSGPLQEKLRLLRGDANKESNGTARV